MPSEDALTAIQPVLDLDAAKKFCVKWIPLEWDEWRIFEVFSRFGLIDNVRLCPLKSKTLNSRQTAFVDMLELIGSRKVRQALNGTRLNVDGVHLCVERYSPQNKEERKPRKESDHHNEKETHTVAFDDDKENIDPENRKPSKQHKYEKKEVSTQSSPMGQFPQKPYHIAHGDLLIGKEETIEIVDPPEDFIEAPGHLTIFLRKKGVDKSYSGMQKELNRYVMARPPTREIPQIGDSVILAHNNIAYRARITGKKENNMVRAYLVDFGKMVLAEETWLICASSHQAALNFHLPQMVVRCELAGISYKNEADVKSVRKIIRTFTNNSRIGFKALTKGFSGIVNMIQLNVELGDNNTEKQDLATALFQRSLCIREEEEKHLTYSSGTLYGLRNCPIVVNTGLPSYLLPFKKIIRKNDN